jgi:hypothetical protein
MEVAPTTPGGAGAAVGKETLEETRAVMQEAMRVFTSTSDADTVRAVRARMHETAQTHAQQQEELKRIVRGTGPHTRTHDHRD